MRYLKGIEVLSVMGNLVDRVWDGQPAYPENEVNPLEVKFCGESWQSKVKSIRSVMSDRGARDTIHSCLKCTWVVGTQPMEISGVPRTPLV